MSEKEILEEACSILEENPSLCLIGALQERTRRFVARVGRNNFEARHRDLENHVMACEILLSCMPLGSSIASWNEEKGRTHDDRIAVLKKAARKA